MKTRGVFTCLCTWTLEVSYASFYMQTRGVFTRLFTYKLEVFYASLHMKTRGVFTCLCTCKRWDLKKQMSKKFAENCALPFLACLVVGQLVSPISLDCQQEPPKTSFALLNSVTRLSPVLTRLQIKPVLLNNLHLLCMDTVFCGSLPHTLRNFLSTATMYFD